MQASRAWRPPGGTLGTILEEVPARVAELSRRRDGLHARISQMPPPSSFVDALRGRTVAVIAEIKRRSPSRGTIRTEISAAAQARAYDEGGAAAVSVLTEPVHFGGTSEDLSAAREATALPILKKDFHVDPVQLLEARSLGASAALLIARALPPEGLATMLREGERIGIETVVEIRDEEELERALEAGARIVGVNHRDLESLEIDLKTGLRLLPQIPDHVVAIAESGIGGRADVERLAVAGADAVLVGSLVSAAEDPVIAVRDLVGVPRRDRAG